MSLSQLPHHVRLEAEASAHSHGYRGSKGELDGWLHVTSMTAPGDLWITARAAEGPWHVAVEHPPVIAELSRSTMGLPSLKPVARKGPGKARYMVADVKELRQLLRRIYQLATSLPDTPLREFSAKTSKLPRATETERMVIQRVGQDIFRKSLIDYWDGCCPLTGITEPALLRASHIKPWAACDSDAERLDVHNGLLLSSLWDAAFDVGLVTFDKKGSVVHAENLSPLTIKLLDRIVPVLKLTTQHQIFMEWHRRHVFMTT